MAGNATPKIKWFSRLLPISEANAGLTTAQKKTRVERECRRRLAVESRGRYEIGRNGFKWESPKKDEPRHKLTVFIKIKGRLIPGPGDPPIPARTPPPSM